MEWTHNPPDPVRTRPAMPEPAPKPPSASSFIRHPDCKACPLHESASNCGIPTRPLKITKKPVALLIIGEKPGLQEDREGNHFVGITGRILQKVFVQAAHLQDYADVYATNAVRCKPPYEATITIGQFKACRPYLLEDLQALKNEYERVVILGGGAGAARTLRGTSLDAAFLHQGEPTLLGCPTFYTFNPYILSPDRDPSKIDAVADHLALVSEYLQSGEVALDLQMPEIETAVHNPGCKVEMLSLDIETYGAVRGFPAQTVFQPQRAVATDGVSRASLVQTVALAWRDSSQGGKVRTSIYDFSNVQHRNNLLYFLQGCEPGTPLLGMNLPFDIMFLRAYDPHPDSVEKPVNYFGLTRDKWRLRDLGVINYLHSEIRPERSLKNLTPLLRITDYHGELSLKAGERYKSASDPALHFYNCKDAVATLIAWERLKARIRRDYGGDTNKLSDYSLDWYNNLLWFAIEASESGITLDRSKLEALDRRLNHQVERLVRCVQRWWDGAIRQKGSKKWLENLAQEAAIKGDLLRDSRLQRTKKTKIISTAEENINLFLGVLPPKSELAAKLRVVKHYRNRSKLLSSFTTPLLRPHREGRRNVPTGSLVGNRAHPVWYVVPSQYEGEAPGGTKQGRITCKNPPFQTFPQVIKECLSTRFNPGTLIDADLSQIELRTGALLSGDPQMIKEYKEGIDRHLRTAEGVLKALWGWMDRQGKQEAFGVRRDWLDSIMELTKKGQLTKKSTGIGQWRQLGKTLNFLMLFKGGPRKAQETAARDVGVLLPLKIWAEAVQDYKNRYPEFLKWQDSLLRAARKDGLIEVPLTGQTRMFRGGNRGVAGAVSEIVNMPIQTVAANTLIAAREQVAQQLRDLRLDAVCNLTIYDSLLIEAPLHEETVILEILKEALSHPTYWCDIQQQLGREVPVEYDVKVKHFFFPPTSKETYEHSVQQTSRGTIATVVQTGISPGLSGRPVASHTDESRSQIRC